MLVLAQRSFLVGPVSFQGPCASGRITVQVQGKIMAPPSTAVSTCSNYWLMFTRVDGLRVTGNGVLDGNGQSWWIRRCSDVALKLVGCSNLEVSQLSSKDSPQMYIAIIESSAVNVWGLTITAPGSSPNTDGIHIERSQNVQITNSRIGTGDDCISISSGSRFVSVDGIECGPGHGGGQGYAKSISFTNIAFDNVDNPVVIDQFYRDRSFEAAVVISNITHTNLKGTSSRPTAVAFDCSNGGSCTDIHVNSLMITGSGGRQTVARCRNAQVTTTGQVYPEIPCRS
ncbi:putative polygalacturonase [Dichanthelium oligosanthes]|uniref:Putative polygalacturonase n=1 Tax=Dichanthelium oligosanthes TaxID=888268 RepID=A0A1E5W0G2_9POAL|nr:putative polygalacturonase [Dichanthelium oligosanthes]